MKQYVNFNYAEKVNKRSQGEIETEFLQFSTQDLKQKGKLKGESSQILIFPSGSRLPLPSSN